MCTHYRIFRRAFAFCVLLALPVWTWAQSALSPQAQISLLTVSKGTALYSAFGHTGLRVHDPVQNIDVVFNYGTFDFNTPNFYLKFLRGQLDYRMSAESFADFQWVYRDLEKRGVIEQTLRLSAGQKQRLFDRLRWNYRPENRFYRYDFFFDNCATRPRDVLETALGDSIRWGKLPDPKKTFRALLDESLLDKRWAKFGMDLVLGQKADAIATQRQVVFLPAYLAELLRHGQIQTASGWQPIVAQEKNIIRELPIPPDNPWPMVVSWFLFAATLMYTIPRFHPVTMPRRRTGDGFILLAYGLAGWVMLLLWLGTDHKVTVQNWNVLWASPLHVAFSVLLWLKPASRWVLIYSSFWLSVLVFTALSWFAIPQHFHPAFLPLILILFTRLLHIKQQFKDHQRLTS